MSGGPVADILWPYETLPPRIVTPELVPATTGGGRSITAVEQIVSYDAGYWGIDLSEIPVVSRAQKIAWRGVSATLNGRLGTCLVPVYDAGPQDTIPWPIVNGQFYKKKPGEILADGSFTNDGSITAALNADADMGAVSISLLMSAGSQLSAGMHLSLGVRLYRIKSVDSQIGGFITSDDGGFVITDDSGHPLGSANVTYGLTIWPPIRETMLNGTPINFAAPVCICRLKTDLEMRSAGDDYAGRALGKVSFEEAINV